MLENNTMTHPYDLGNVINSIIYPYFSLVDELPIPQDEFWAQLGITLEQLKDPQAYFPGHQFMTLLSFLRWISEDELIGVKAAAHVRPGTFGSLGFIVMNAKTLKDAIQSIIPLQGVLGNIGEAKLTLNESGGFFTWQCHYPLPEVSQLMVDAMLCSWFVLIRQILGPGVESPRSVYLQRTQPVHRVKQVYHRVLKCPIYFSKSVNGIELSNQLLNHPIPSYQSDVAQVLIEHTAKKLCDQPMMTPLRQIQKIIGEALMRGHTIRREKLAQQMCMSGRTMQRYLQKQGTGFQAVLDGVRLQYAQTWLAQTNWPLEKIAHRLGFRDLSSFHRGFKRWSGQSPYQYRLQQMPAHLKQLVTSPKQFHHSDAVLDISHSL